MVLTPPTDGPGGTGPRGREEPAGPPGTESGRPTLGAMDSRSEISSFLTSRRAKLSPEQAGVPLYSGARRVPGLRREEVAHLAGVSVDYYARLERGKISGASREVMEAIARALQLDEDERDHLLDLARIIQRRAPRRKPSNPAWDPECPGLDRCARLRAERPP